MPSYQATSVHLNVATALYLVVEPALDGGVTCIFTSLVALSAVTEIARLAIELSYCLFSSTGEASIEMLFATFFTVNVMSDAYTSPVVPLPLPLSLVAMTTCILTLTFRFVPLGYQCTKSVM